MQNQQKEKRTNFRIILGEQTIWLQKQLMVGKNEFAITFQILCEIYYICFKVSKLTTF